MNRKGKALFKVIAFFVSDTGFQQSLGGITIRPRSPAAMMESGEPSTVFCDIDKGGHQKWRQRGRNCGDNPLRIPLFFFLFWKVRVNDSRKVSHHRGYLR